MLRILVCCGGGFSSSYVTERMKKEIIERNLENEIYMEFYPFGIAKSRFNEFDVAILCPHLFMSVRKLLAETNPTIPLYLLPPKMYGSMELLEVYQDCKDVVAMYTKNPVNPVHFPNEENVMKIRRGKAYRHTYKNFEI